MSYKTSVEKFKQALQIREKVQYTNGSYIGELR